MQRAANLCREAGRDTLFARNEHAFDHLPIVKLQQKLSGFVAALRLAGNLRPMEREIILQLRTQGHRQVRHLKQK